MGAIRTFLGPKSKYDKTLPYTYMARVDALSGQGREPLYQHYFADTICGLIEHLAESNIAPEEVELFGMYLDKEIPLEIEYCTTPDGKWLKRPAICKSREEHYEKTLENRYKGHVADGECSFDDRDRTGDGPY